VRRSSSSTLTSSPHFAPLGRLIAAIVCILHLAGCGERTLWERDFTKSQAAKASATAKSEITGYWEGQVFAGSVRLKIEPANIVAAIRCDVHGDVVTSQGTAMIALQTDRSPGRIVLKQDLAGDREGCGFLFVKGSEFAFAFVRPEMIEMSFSGTAVAQLKKLADLEPANR
jgi:hypothetical protein